MGDRAEQLAQRIRAFADEVVTVVDGCPTAAWKRRCEAEDWSAGVTARHIAAGHLELLGLVRAMVGGEALPRFTREQIVGMANEHARAHADCTREEVAELMRRNGAAMADYVAGLQDADLDRRCDFVGRDMTVQQFLETVILLSGGGHLASVKAAIAAA
jgi:hypothetical protein